MKSAAIYNFNQCCPKHINLWDNMQAIKKRKSIDNETNNMSGGGETSDDIPVRGTKKRRTNNGEKIVESDGLQQSFDKRRKLSIDEEFVSGTAVKNHLLKDPILDWLDLYYSEDIHKNIVPKRKLKCDNSKSNTDALSILFKNGNDFEDKVIEYLKKEFDRDLVIINADGRNGMTFENYENTSNAMKNGIPIIVQGVLFNEQNNTGGIADLIVRSDFINKLVRRQVLSHEKEIIRAPKLDGNYHYRVIDIKWTGMTLCANGYNIRNDDRFPCYKGQLAIYNCAMGLIQGYTPFETYIMAKSWKIDRKNDPLEGYNCFDLLGVIDYDNFDYQYVEKTVDAINWIRDVRKNGFNWDVYNSDRYEMYPNYNNKNDAPWTNIKKNICEKKHEITQICYVQDIHRKNAIERGVISWKDPRCTSELMGITGDMKPALIDAILDINRDNNCKIDPEIIKNNLMNWQISSPVDFYVDFETANGCFSNINIDIHNSKCDPDIVFMIGVGYVENNTWIYKVFYSNELTLIEEERIFDEFTTFINDKSRELNMNITDKYIPRLFHWTNAEVTNLKHANDRHRNKWTQWESTILWVDMYYVFFNEPIVVKGSLTFKLKDIGKAMYNMQMINTTWNDEGPHDGLDAMIQSIKYYKNKMNNIQSRDDIESFKLIIDYNEIDCKVIWDIVSYLRKNNCKPNMFLYDLALR